MIIFRIHAHTLMDVSSLCYVSRRPNITIRYIFIKASYSVKQIKFFFGIFRHTMAFYMKLSLSRLTTKILSSHILLWNLLPLIILTTPAI